MKAAESTGGGDRSGHLVASLLTQPFIRGNRDNRETTNMERAKQMKAALSFKSELAPHTSGFDDWRHQLKFPRTTTALTNFAEVALKNGLKPFLGKNRFDEFPVN